MFFPCKGQWSPKKLLCEKLMLLRETKEEEQKEEEKKKQNSICLSNTHHTEMNYTPPLINTSGNSEPVDINDCVKFLVAAIMCTC